MKPSSRWRRWLPGAVALVGFAALLAIPGHSFKAGCAVSRSASTLAGGQIAFTCYGQAVGDVANGDVFLAGVDGRDVHRLTRGWAWDGEPAWTSDGSRVAYTTTRDGNYEIYAMNADGTGTVRLTRSSLLEFEPDWSPDGARIVFVGTRWPNQNIFVMNDDGTGITALTSGPWRDYDPDWSPDGSRIAFTSNRSGSWQVYVMRADGSGLTPLTKRPGEATQPDWSPDGSRIAYTHIPSPGADARASVYTANPDGTGARQIVEADSYLPAWSPDGSAIAFESTRDGSAHIWIVVIGGGAPVRFTDGPAEAFSAAWRPLPSNGAGG